MAVDPKKVFEGEQAEAYKQHVRENWDKLQPWEQQQAREFLIASKHPRRIASRTPAPISSPKVFLNDVRSEVAHPELYWTIRAGWVCVVATLLLSPLLFGVVGVAVGFYNAKKGEHETGVLQIGLTILAAVFAILIYLAGAEILGGIMPSPTGPFR